MVLLVTCRASLSAHINGLIQRILNLVPKDFKSKKFERLFPFSKQKDRGIYEVDTSLRPGLKVCSKRMND